MNRIAAMIAMSYVAIVIGGMVLHFAMTGERGTLWYSVTLPATVGVIVLGPVIAVGLWRAHSWAWWLGLVAAVVQLERLGPWLLTRFESGQVPLASWLIAAHLLTFLVLLLIPATRATCVR